MIKEILEKIYRKDIELTYLPDLYLSDSIRSKNMDKLKEKIAKGKGSCKLILVSERSDENFDIVTPGQLRYRIWDGKKPLVCGIGQDENEAFEIVMKITEDCMRDKGDLNLKEYICS